MDIPEFAFKRRLLFYPASQMRPLPPIREHGCSFVVVVPSPQGENPVWTRIRAGFSNGETGGARTHDHKLKRLVLYRLSYRPAISGSRKSAGGSTLPHPGRTSKKRRENRWGGAGCIPVTLTSSAAGSRRSIGSGGEGRHPAAPFHGNRLSVNETGMRPAVGRLGTAGSLRGRPFRCEIPL